MIAYIIAFIITATATGGFSFFRLGDLFAACGTAVVAGLVGVGVVGFWRYIRSD